MEHILAESTEATSNFSFSTLTGNVPLSVGIRRFFYAILPQETSFAHSKDVPDYLNEAVPFFLAAILLEQFTALIRGLPKLRFNDGLSSISAGIFSQLSRLVVFSFEMMTFTYFYDHYRLVTLPWDSPWTWYLCFLGVDLAYYCLHRASHEVNIMWAAHQVHHSSEDYNLSTALRQSVIQNFTVFLFWMPMALGIPPSIFLVHLQFNTLYQFWIHTEIVRSVGPLEWILNTPSHHRVHHGRNPYCIDKNYGGTLIIWDRLFGTFQAEKTDEQLAYGLVHPLASWNPLWTQVCHLAHIWNTFWAMPGFGNKLSVIFKGPGWTPGQPRLGNPEDLPEIESPIVKYDSAPSAWRTIYFIAHFLLFFVSYQQLVTNKSFLNPLNVWCVILFMLFTLTSSGATFDNMWYAPYLELTRCLMFLLIDGVLSTQKLETGVLPSSLLVGVRTFFMLSAFLWMLICIASKTKRLKTD